MSVSTRFLLPTFAALMATNLIGLVVGVADDFASLGSAAVNGTYTNAPLAIYLTQGAGVCLLPRRARAGAALVLVASTASLTAVALDGDFANDRLGAGHVAIQVAVAALTLALAAVTAVAVARMTRARRTAAAVA